MNWIETLGVVGVPTGAAMIIAMVAQAAVQGRTVSPQAALLICVLLAVLICAWLALCCFMITKPKAQTA